MTIDFTRVITAGQKAAGAAEARATAIRSECRARILAVASEVTQMNIAQVGVIYAALRADGASEKAARDAVGFEPDDLTRAAGWKAWVSAMQAECRRAIRAGDAPAWPDLPEGVADLAARF
ncbi:MAG: hypothetical protein H5U15_01065 [Roseovarius sp.]|jgi:hypothetical protein|nr:hypothetical protein [Roseovarius sp.]